MDGTTKYHVHVQKTENRFDKQNAQKSNRQLGIKQAGI